MRTLSAAAVQQLGVSSSQRLSRSDSGSAPKANPRQRVEPKTKAPAAVLVPSDNGQPPHLVSCESCTPKSKGKVQGEPKRPDGHANPRIEAWCHPAVIATAPTLRQDRVQGEEGKRRNQTVETRAVTC